MATTTATVTVSSTDLMDAGTLSISGTATLTKAGVTTGLNQMESGVMSVATGTEFRLGPLATQISGSSHDIASYLFLCNTSTDVTYYID